MARLKINGVLSSYANATISHTQDCLDQPATAVTPFNRLFSTRTPYNSFTLSVVSPPPGGPYYHAGWTINYADGEIDTAGPGDLTLEIEQSIGHGTMIIAEFSDDIEEFQKCSSFNLNVPRYLRVTLPTSIDRSYGCEDTEVFANGTPVPCGGHSGSVFDPFDFGVYNKYNPTAPIIVECESVRTHLYPPTAGRNPTGPVDVVTYTYANSHGECLRVELWIYWKLITDRFSTYSYNWRSNIYRWTNHFGCVRDNNLYFKPVVEAKIYLSFVDKHGGITSRKFYRTQHLAGSLASAGFQESALLAAYRAIAETSCDSPDDSGVCVGILDETFNQVWGGNGLPGIAWGLGPPWSPLQIFDSVGDTLSGIGDIGTFSDFYEANSFEVDTVLGIGSGSNPFYNELGACHNHLSTDGFDTPYLISTVDPNQVQAASKCALQFVPSFGQVYSDPYYPGGHLRVEDRSLDFSHNPCPEAWSGTQLGVKIGKISAIVEPVSTLLPGEFPNETSDCKCLTIPGAQSIVTSGLYVHKDFAGSILDEPCVIECGPEFDEPGYPYGSNNLFPPKIRVLLPAAIDLSFLNVPPDCVDNAFIAKNFHRTSGREHVLSTQCSDITTLSFFSPGIDLSSTPFEELYWLGDNPGITLYVISAEYKFDTSGPNTCSPPTRVFLDIGWFANTGPAWYGCGPDAVEKRILFTQCRIIHVDLGGFSAVPQCNYHAINFGPEFSFPDFYNPSDPNDDRVFTAGLLDNVWNWQSQNFVFNEFYHDKFYGEHPNNNPFGEKDCEFSYDPGRYRYSAAKKIYGGSVEEFCPDPLGVPCYYPTVPGSTPTSPPPFAGGELCAYGKNHKFLFQVHPWFDSPVDPRCGDENDNFARYDE